MSVGSGLREASGAAGAAAVVVKGEDVETVLSDIRRRRARERQLDIGRYGLPPLATWR